MNHWLLVLLALAAGCGPAPSGLSPDDAFQASLAAVGEGDVPRALALLDEAAEAGHLGALDYRARSYRHGYLRTDWSAATSSRPGKIEETHAFLVLPGQARAAQADYRRALDAAADTDDLGAMRQLAFELGQPRWIGGEWTTRPSALDSARVLYDRMQALGADPLDLANLARVLNLDDAHRAHLQAAAEAGDPVACLQRAYNDHGYPFSARGMAPAIDALEACRRLAAGGVSPVSFDQNVQRLGDLAAQVRSGNDQARAILDSLRADGVFERHPRLAAVVAG